MIDSIIFVLTYVIQGAWAIIKGFAIGLLNNPTILVMLIILIVGSIIRKKLLGRK